MNRVYSCVAKYWALDEDASPVRIESALKNSKAFEFLILWSIFEAKLFKGFCRKELLSSYAQESNIEIAGIDCIVRHFHDRYAIPQTGKRNELYRNLIHRDCPSDVDAILTKSYDELLDSEKKLLILYTIFRYRNNIFHGNKGVDSWQRYEKQIEKCLDAMLYFIDNHVDSNARAA